ncbi:unnamed protein product, partial [Laminaria digitata]
SSKSVSKLTDRHNKTQQRKKEGSNMRHNRQTTRRAVVMALVQALLKNNNRVGTDAFSAIALKHATGSMETDVCGARGRVGGGCRPTDTTTAVTRRCVNRRQESATATSNSSESYSSYGGAEGIAQRLAEGGDGGAAGVFYNRVGAINRDLSILMANVLAEERSKE